MKTIVVLAMYSVCLVALVKGDSQLAHMAWLTPELVDTIASHLTFGGAGILILMFWIVACKYGLPKKGKGKDKEGR